MNINFKVSEELNAERITLKLSWRDLIMRGLQASRDPYFKPILPPQEELLENLNKALKNLRADFVSLIAIRDSLKNTKKDKE